MNVTKVERRMSSELLESDIERTICDFLEADGWRCLKMEQNFSERKRKAVGEKGMPDRLCIRYDCSSNGRLYYPDEPARAQTQTLWLEAKRRGGKAATHQKAWHAAERARGALTLILGEDCPASIEGFREFYIESGLARRVR